MAEDVVIGFGRKSKAGTKEAEANGKVDHDSEDDGISLYKRELAAEGLDSY